ncbi:Hypothetical protein NTJ_09526 [Nesidiocoris tenuis]|uniref:Uncharacterized protein n=1 Tax=Nesidiocoris tenuis TaxID=355587 RepID=A0ABN7AXM2_9HEMI|nr:Hypothetical protein NTJ_09526 [Nesidiocoris tenuis]
MLLVILTLTALGSALSQKSTTGIDKLRDDTIRRIDHLWMETAGWQMFAKKKSGLDADLVTEFKKICDDIDAFHHPELPSMVLDHMWAYGLIAEEEDNILGSYATFRKAQARPDPVIFADLWRQVANGVLHDRINRRSILKSLSIVQEMIDDGIEGHKNTFDNALKNAEDFTCDVNQSPQQMLFNLYTTFQLTQLKAYTMAHFSWMLLRIYNQGNFTVESERLKTSYLQRMSQQALAIKSVMRDSKNDLWACDPKQHVDGETFVKITKFLQGYIVNEVDLNGDNTCRENCAFYTYGKQQGCFKDQFCARQPPCRGSIVGCKFVDSDMHVCQAPHFSERRYDWIEYENGRTLGQRKQCNRAVQPVDSWWRYLFWHCSYCFCFCDDPKDGGSDRYFSLRSVTSDTAKNKVVTGMRFVKKGRIVHLQIQQGDLLPHGDINETTVEWVPVQEFDINGEGVEVGRDYHMLTWEHRALDLDDVTLPSGHILTGVKLRRIGGHLNLEIQGTQFNYTKGLLKHNGTRSQWFGNDNTDGALDQPRTMHKLKNPDAPDKSNGLNEVDSRPDTFIEFTSSDAELDVAQTAVPFIDIQPVAPKPPTALVGAGILHKGRPYSGGYVAPKLFTYNQGEHVHDHFPDLNEAEF